MTIPDGMPTLSAGGHGPDSGLACLMEYISVLAGEEWSDTPNCTLLTLSYAAQRANDTIGDDDRHLLIPLISRLMDTNPSDPAMQIAANKALFIYLCDTYPEQTQRLYPETSLAQVKEEMRNFDLNADCRYVCRSHPHITNTLVHKIAQESVRIICDAIYSTNRSCLCGCKSRTRTYDPAVQVRVLTGLIDAYEKFIGAGDPEPIPQEQFDTATAKIAEHQKWYQKMLNGGWIAVTKTAASPGPELTYTDM